MQSSEKRQKAIDLSHHLSDLSRARATSPLKGLARYFGRPGLISLAGGTSFLPTTSSYDACMEENDHSNVLVISKACPARTTSRLPPFPEMVGVVVRRSLFGTATEQAPSESSLSWLWKLFGSNRKEKTSSITIPKFPAHPDDVNLATALQYGTATGLPQLQKFINDFVKKVYQPAYEDWTTLVQTGNTDG
ncbi:hypothetical protein NUW54_g1370 [Trametes sanguinea]|uniref:Uncharacterized protein n=1 Tax=Trametes sanguinea TaxID=158606 RepID=A0ACC1Q6I7_9APHY|nr:hypothetical protein NUW54_g1370 [Trametes sanguinea]